MRDFASACFGCMSKTESAKSEKEQTLRDDGRRGDGSRRFYNRTSAVVVMRRTLAHANGEYFYQRGWQSDDEGNRRRTVV